MESRGQNGSSQACTKVNIYPYRKMYLAFLAGMKLEGGRDFLLAWKQLSQ